MLREIKKYPDKVLRKKSREVEEFTDEIRELARDMVETLGKNDGVGLAAPQIGELKRIIAIQTSKEPVVFVNPRIVKKSRETEKEEEGCLSLPDFWLKIKRPKRIEVEAFDINGKKININKEGLQARIIQHEIDHLNGILIIDRLSFFQKLKMKFKAH